MINVEKINQLLQKPDENAKTCPICGVYPKKTTTDLDNSYGGCVISYSCAGCELLQGEGVVCLDGDINRAEKIALKSWNDICDCVNALIDKTRGIIHD